MNRIKIFKNRTEQNRTEQNRTEQNRTEQNRTEQYYSIDLCKYIMALFVVAIHTKPLNHLQNSYINGLITTALSLAVPFFFISSGFLIFNKMKELPCIDLRLSYLKKHTYKLIKSYIIWSVIYFPIALYGYKLENVTWKKAFIIYIRDLFVKGDHFYSWPLWYLLSSIYALLVIIFLVKMKKFNVNGMIMIIILFIILEHGTDYLIFTANKNGFIGFIGTLLEKTIVQGRIFSGTYFMIIGTLLSKLDLCFKRFDLRIYCISFICTFILSTFSIPYFELIMYISFFECIIRCKLNCKNGIVFRRLSTEIYYVHMLPFFFFTLIVGMDNRYGMTAFLVTLISTQLIALILNSKPLRMSKLIQYLVSVQ